MEILLGQTLLDAKIKGSNVSVEIEPAS